MSDDMEARVTRLEAEVARLRMSHNAVLEVFAAELVGLRTYLEERFDRLEAKVDGLEAKVDGLTSTVDTYTGQVNIAIVGGQRSYRLIEAIAGHFGIEVPEEDS